MPSFLLNYIRTKTNKLLLEYEHACRRSKEEKELLEKAEKRIQTAENAQRILQEIAQHIQNKAHTRIAAIVTKCLQVVFGEESPTFEIRFERKRGKTEARLLFVQDGNEIIPTEEDGGGIVDVASFALQVAAVMMRRPPLRRLIVADEPFKHLSSEYRQNIGQMLEELSEKTGMQIIMVTHSEELKIGKVIEVT